MGKNYCEGGIEFFEKLIIRNLALRKLVPEGEKIINEDGEKRSLVKGLKSKYRDRLETLKVICETWDDTQLEVKHKVREAHSFEPIDNYTQKIMSKER